MAQSLTLSPPGSQSMGLAAFPAFSPTPSYGYVPGKAMSGSSHAKLHKRGNSASSLTSPTSPASAERPSFNFKRTETPKTTFEDISWEPPQRPAPVETKAPKIKPYLKKLGSKDKNKIDLSRPAAENQGLTGLGINDGFETYKSASEVQFSSMGPRRHRRSTSNTSQFSTTSSLQRPSAPYMHPMRQTPRPYTPPISQSYPASRRQSEEILGEEADDIMSDEDFKYKQPQVLFDPSRRSGSISSTSAIQQHQPSLTLHTSDSFTKLGSSYSTTSLSLGSPATRSRGDTVRSFETAASPSSRPSIDKAFGFLHSRGRDSPIDAATRAREIKAARQAYAEKEEAKERKAEKEALKQADRDIRKQSRQDERRRRKIESRSRSGSISVTNSNEKIHSYATTTTATSSLNNGASGHHHHQHAHNGSGDRRDLGGRVYEDYAPTHTLSMPTRADTAGHSRRTEATPMVTKTRQAKSRWLAFISWFRTRLLRMGRS